MKPREDYIRDEFNEKFRVWFVKVCVLTAGVFLLSSGLDPIRQTGVFLAMLVHRLPAVLVLFAVAFSLRKFKGRGMMLPYALAFLTILFCTAEVEHRIILTGGSESPFFLDIILIGILFVGYVPGSIWFWVPLAASICIVYAVPLMIYDTGDDMREVAFKTAYIVLAYLVLLYMRLLRNRAVIRQLGLRYELLQKDGSLK